MEDRIPQLPKDEKESLVAADIEIESCKIWIQSHNVVQCTKTWP